MVVSIASVDREVRVRLDSYRNLSVPNFSVHLLREILEEAGLDWRGALARADIAPTVVERAGGTIPAHKELAFQREFVSLTPDRVDLWLRAARAYASSTTGARGMALATAPTVAAWTEVASSTDYAPGMLIIAPLRTPTGAVTGIEFNYAETPSELIPFSVYRDLTIASRSLAWLHASPFPFTRVEVPIPTIAEEELTYVDCRIDTHSDALRLWWDPDVSQQALPYGNAFQHAAWVQADQQVITSFREAGDWPATVAQVVRSRPELTRKLANVAAVLRVSPRTLQRRLDSAGHEFGEIRDKALNDLAGDLLSNTDQSIAQISQTLGYTDPASFTIAFKRWTGVPPSAFREAARYDGTAS